MPKRKSLPPQSAAELQSLVEATVSVFEERLPDWQTTIILRAPSGEVIIASSDCLHCAIVALLAHLNSFAPLPPIIEE